MHDGMQYDPNQSQGQCHEPLKVGKFVHEWNEPSCLYSASIHQMAPFERIRLQLTTRLSNSKG